MLIQRLVLLDTATPATCQGLYAHFLQNIATDFLLIQLNRQEPKVVKRRPKPFRNTIFQS